MELRIRENAEYSVYSAFLFIWESSQDDPEGKKYDDGFVATQKDGKESFYIDIYNRPSRRYRILLALHSIVHGFELLLLDSIAEKLGIDKLYVHERKSISFAKAIDLYNSFAGAPLDRDMLLKIKEKRNKLEHDSLSESYDRILGIIKYMSCELFILYRYQHKTNMLSYYGFDPWSEQEVPFYQDMLSMITGSDRIRERLLGLVIPNDAYYCIRCGYKSVQGNTRLCAICNERSDILLD